MASSREYYSLMLQYSRDKRNAQEIKMSYESYLSKIKCLKNELDEVVTNVDDANSNFLNGGYLHAENTSLDNGQLLQISNKLNNDLDVLNNVISKVEAKIQEFDSSINRLTNLYNDANSNYIREKSKEKSG